MADESAGKPKRKAEQCPWYLLATLYGVPESNDDELQMKNRVAWNHLVASLLSDDARAKLPAVMEPQSSFTPPESMALLEKVFAARRGPGSSVTFPQSDKGPPQIDFSNVEFGKSFHAQGFVFPPNVSFSHATFAGDAWFDSATFSGAARFDSATFLGHVASFARATFSGVAWFTRTTFSGAARFDSATFSRGARFNSATFSGDSLFINTEMKSVTSFEVALFVVWPPLFFGAKLHEGTVWRGIKWLLVAIAGVQTVAGAILLFLFGLALRNRFRMR
jgi:hypothetical protein